MDILNTQFLKPKQFPFLINNKDVVISEKKMHEIKSKVNTHSAAKDIKKVKAFVTIQLNLLQLGILDVRT